MSESPHDPIDHGTVDDGPVDGVVDGVEAEPVEQADSGPRGPVAVETGHPAVDEVLRSLGRLDELPVSEHVALYEDAHEALRRALSEARDAEPGNASAGPEA